MNIAENITREDFSTRGGGVELDLTAFGYEDEFLSAYQNYLGGGMLGGIGRWMRSSSDSPSGWVSITKTECMSLSISMSSTRYPTDDQ